MRRFEYFQIGLLGLVVSAACDRASEPPQARGALERANLWGYRALADRPPQTVPIFDHKRMPVLRLEGVDLPDEGISVTLEMGAAEHAGIIDAPQRRDGGVLVRVRPPQGGIDAGLGAVMLNVPGYEPRRWPVIWSVPPEELPPVAPIVAARRAGQLEQARVLLEAAWPRMNADERMWGSVERARLLMGSGGREAVVEAWLAAARQARSTGVPTEVSRRLRAAAFVELRHHRLEEAERLRSRAKAHDAKIGHDSTARSEYLGGLIASARNDFGTALLRLRRARDAAWRSGQDRDLPAIHEMLGVTLQEQGHHREAWEAIEKVRPFFEARKADRVLYGRYLNMAGWVLMRGMFSGVIPQDFSRPRALFEQARALLPAGGDAEAEANIVFNLAWMAWRAGAPERARSHLAELQGLTAASRAYATGAVELGVLRAELLLVEGHSESAARAFAAAEAHARQSWGGEHEYTWQARYGRGRALLALGQREAALAAYFAALQALDVVGQRAPLRESRAFFFAERRALVDETIELLLSSGQVAQAFQVADEAQARVLRSLESQVRISRLDPAKRATWENKLRQYHADRAAFEAGRADAELLAGPSLEAWHENRRGSQVKLARRFDDLHTFLDQESPTPSRRVADAALVSSALLPGQALVEFVRVGQTTHGFWINPAGIHHFTTDATLRGDWTQRLRGQSHLYIVTGGVEEALSLPARALDDRRPLLAHVGVSYLPHAGHLLSTPPPALGPALIVADPNVNLAFARADGRQVARQLDNARLLEGSAATRAAVSSGLDGASLFHFAGHAELNPDHPWEGHLRLNGDEALSLSDVLVIRPRMGVVVLNGCATGRPLKLAGRERVGLAEAFLAAGARTVLATTRPVGDAEATRLMKRFYAHGGARRPGLAWRAAALESIQAGDDVWKAYRLVGRP